MGKTAKKTARAAKASGTSMEALDGTPKVFSTWVLVETVELTRRRYAIETPGNKTAWALDTVVMGEALPLSTVPLGETIVSCRAVSEGEALSLAREDGVGGHEARARFLELEE